MLHINKNLDIYIDQTIQIIKEQPNVLDWNEIKTWQWASYMGPVWENLRA